MPLVYAFVARGTTVLAEHAAYAGNFKSVALECLQKARSHERRFSVTTDGHSFNFANENGLIFLVVADDGHGREVPLGCLDRIVADYQVSAGGVEGLGVLWDRGLMGELGLGKGVRGVWEGEGAGRGRQNRVETGKVWLLGLFGYSDEVVWL